VTALLFKLVGGIGLFLLGMVLLTDGLKAFAGDALRRALIRFTGTPRRAFGSGALVTMIVQSSSATTVTVIGFVSAGLLTFPQALGVVIGASLGTTGTGWIVAVLGLKISVGFYALPLVGIGAFMKLLGRGRWRSFGLALAGFGLIFVGIETLQDAMSGLSGIFNVSELPATGLWSHLLSMLIGVAMTVVMQSSSAAVATTLTALHTGAINFEQAASLVIGAAVGTTVTGVLAAIGGNIPAKRTALAHVIFNLATGLIAVVLLPVFLRLITLAQNHLGLDPGATSLAAFHTVFIATGAALFLPLVHLFARLIERWLPEEEPTLTRHLDASLLHAPAVALEATRRALRQLADESFQHLAELMDSSGLSVKPADPAPLRSGLEGIREFFARIPPLTEDEPMSHSRVSQLHAIDHLFRLQSRLEPPLGVRSMLGHDRLLKAVEHCRQALRSGIAGLRAHSVTDALDNVEQHASALAEFRRQQRPALFQETASGSWGPARALEALDAMRWLDLITYHAWRICHHLGMDDSSRPVPGEPECLPTSHTILHPSAQS
jgi:phosphate:Na+ symporter